LHAKVVPAHKLKRERADKGHPMSDTNILQVKQSRRVPLIAIGILLVVIAFLALQRFFPLGSFFGSKPAGSGAPAAEAKPAGADKPQAGDGKAQAQAKPAGGGATGMAGKMPPTPVKVAQVKEAMMTDDVSAVGSVLAEESVVIRPEIAGRVTKIHFAEGQEVKAGAPLVSIDPAELRAQLAQTTADVTLNQQRYDRARDMHQQNFMSRQALDEASSNLARASAGKQEILARLAKTEIHAPFTGVLGLRKISAGAYVKPGDDIVGLEQIAAVKLDFRVPEIFLDKIRREQDVNIRVDAYPKNTFSGKIYAVEPVVDEQTRTVLLRARVPNPEHRLKPGMFARVGLILEKRGAALVIPEEAIVPKGQDSFVVRVVDGKAEFVKVRTGKRLPGQVEILEGLSAKDTVVTDGHSKLQPGAQVMVLGAQPPPRADGNGGKKS
jgi:membrane fusion protein, multidrug efflux system